MILFLRGRHCHKVYSGEFFLPVTLPWVMSPKLTGSLSCFVFQTTCLTTYFASCTLHFKLIWLVLCMQILELTLPMPYLSIFDLSMLQLSTPTKNWVCRRKWTFLSFGQGGLSEEYGYNAVGKGLVWFLFLSMQQDWVNVFLEQCSVLQCSVDFWYGILKRDKHRQGS